MCMEYAMLAEIFMLRAETAAREAAKDAARFVPITLPELQRRRGRRPKPTSSKPTARHHVETAGLSGPLGSGLVSLITLI